MKYLYLLAVHYYLVVIAAGGACIASGLDKLSWWVSLPLVLVALLCVFLRLVLSNINFQ